ncbi:sialate O-acetylesterase [Microbacterium sp. W4I4]|uniref:sialate O-acetylesterase n=1 Tax=Microbacterium sp. W4I4 TaxID=3042295 RepID=UPI0027D8FDF2|nr:sialate O-acetylesterase [Microbacterium sp. W4I4]
MTISTTLGLMLSTHTASPASATSTDPVFTTTCEQHQATEGMVPIRSIDIPIAGPGWYGTNPTYDFETTDIPAVDRVGYCLEMESDSGEQWVWAAHEATGEASDLRLPTGPAEVTRREARDLTVRSNVAGVPPVDHGTGWIEMWPNSYTATASRLLPGTYDGVIFSGDAKADADDIPVAGAYGSFQVHQVTEDAATTVLAVNGWASSRAALDLGIGQSDTGHPDWTFAANAAQWDTRRLTFYGRPAGVVLEAAPEPWQLIPRDGQDATEVGARFAGRVTSADITDIILRSTTGSDTTERSLDVVGGAFDVEAPVPVALADTTFELIAVSGGTRRVIRTIPGVVGGDVYVVHGQSNASARRWGDVAYAAQDHFVRSYGSTSDVPQVSIGDRGWSVGQADTVLNLGSIGQWGTRFGARLARETGVPVAIMNGAHGGHPVSFFARNDSDPQDPTTNYGRLLGRLVDGGLADHVAGIFWVQGEDDANDVATHVAGVTELISDLRTDLAASADAIPELFEVQVRRSPCTDTRATELRDAQRRMARDLGATLMTLNGLTDIVGCHFDFVNGYRDLGDWAFETVRSVIGGQPAAGVRAADASAVSQLTPRLLRVHLLHPDPLTIPAQAGAGFAFAGSSIAVTSVRQDGASLLLETSAPVSPGMVLEYVGFGAGGPWIRNRIGMGMVTFREDVLAAPADETAPVVSLVSPTAAGPVREVVIEVTARDAIGLTSITADLYDGDQLVKTTKTTMGGVTAGTHTATVTVPDGDYTIRYNAQDTTGNISDTGTFDITVDTTAPTVTTDDHPRNTIEKNGGYTKVSFVLDDTHEITTVTLNGHTIEVTPATHLELPTIKPGTLGAIRGTNELTVTDTAGNQATRTFELT